MGNEWKDGTLADIADVLMGQSPPGKDCSKDIIGPPLLNGPTEFGAHSPLATQYTSNPKRMSKEGDLLFCVRGSTTGRMNWANKEYALGRGLAAIRCRDEGCQHYLRGVIDYGLNELLSLATGSTFPNVSRNQILGIELPLPPLPEQKAIAHILGSLDDKIELNRKMNATLEGMAQALFKSWFVDFDPVIDNALEAGNPIPEEFAARARLRQGSGGQAETRKKVPDLGKAASEFSNVRKLFPDSFQTSELGPIPTGWDVGKINDLADLNSESWSKKNHPEHVIYVDLANTKNGRINEVSPYDYSDAPSRARRVLREDDTIIGTVRPGNRSFAYIHEDGLTGSTGFAVLRPKQENARSFIYLCLTQDDVIENFAHLADGGAYPAIRPEVVGNRETVIFDSNLMQFFDEQCYPLIQKIGQHQRETATLTNLRDTLLPKLISGELRVAGAEKMEGDVRK